MANLISRPIKFTGSNYINFATSAAGSIRVELQDAAGEPIPGFALADCPEIFGDTVDRIVTWKSGSDVANWPVKLCGCDSNFVTRICIRFSLSFDHD